MKWEIKASITNLFATATITEKGSQIIYSREGETVTLEMETVGLLKEVVTETEPDTNMREAVLNLINQVRAIAHTQGNILSKHSDAERAEWIRIQDDRLAKEID